MYDLYLTAEQIEIRDTVRDFVRNEVKPVTLHPGRLEPFAKPLLTEILGAASKMGLRALTLSEECGGAGADNLTACIVLEELAQGDPDVAAVLARTSVLAHIVFDELMTAEQRTQLLPQFMDDHEFHLAFAGRAAQAGLAPHYHQPGAGDPGSQVKAARQAGGEWILNGTVSAVADAPIAKAFAVDAGAVGTSGRSVFLVPRDTAGLSVREVTASDATGGSPAIAWHHGPAGEVAFGACRVPASALLATEGQSAAAGTAYAARSAVQLAAANIGIGQVAYEAAIEYAKLRRQGGKPIIEHQAIGTLLAEIAIKLEAVRNTVWKAAWTLDHADAVSARSVSDLPLHHIACVYAGETIVEVTERAAECFGAMGVMRDMPLQKYVNDALVFKYSGLGASASKLLIAEALAGFERHASSGSE